MQKKFTNLGEKHFFIIFLEITMFWNEKFTKMREIHSENFLFWSSLKTLDKFSSHIRN